MPDVIVAEKAAVVPMRPLHYLERIIDKAGEKGLDPDVLVKLTDLAERWRAAEAKASFEAAMNRVQSRLPTVVRDMVNKETGKKFAPVETVQAYVKPVYIPEGFNCFFTADPGSAADLWNVHLDISHVDGHTKRTTLPNVGLDNKGMKGGATKTEVQGLMSSMSYAQGRLLRMGFNIIVGDEDRDGTLDAIGPKQLEEIESLFMSAEVSYKNAGEPEAAWSKYRTWFYKWLGIESMRDLTPRKLTMAEDELKMRIDTMNARRGK